MSNGNATAVVRGFKPGALCAAIGVVLGCASTDPTSGSNDPGRVAPTATGSQEMVDCLLPGQIRRLDENVTYLTERRLVQTTKGDCAGRGGVVQPTEGPKGSSPESGK